MSITSYTYSKLKHLLAVDVYILLGGDWWGHVPLRLGIFENSVNLAIRGKKSFSANTENLKAGNIKGILNDDGKIIF